MKKLICILLTVTLFTTLFTSCRNNTQTEKVKINIAVLKGPTGMGTAQLMERNEANKTTNHYTFTVATAPDQITAKLINGELDIAMLPTNALAALYNKTNGGITLLGINTLGVLYVLAKGDTVTTVNDLKGKTILTSGKGSTAEYVLNYILKENGIDEEKDVTVEYVTEHSEVAARAAAGKADIVLLPEPFATSLQMQNSDFERKIDLTEEWQKLTNAKLTMGAIGVRTEFLQKNPQAVEDFLTEYETSVNDVNADTAESAALIEKYDIAKAAVAEKAIPTCNIVLIRGTEMKTDAENFLNIMYQFDPASVGGKMPGESFYYLGNKS